MCPRDSFPRHHEFVDLLTRQFLRDGDPTWGGYNGQRNSFASTASFHLTVVGDTPALDGAARSQSRGREVQPNKHDNESAHLWALTVAVSACAINRHSPDCEQGDALPRAE